MIGYIPSLFCGLTLVAGVFGIPSILRRRLLMIALASSCGLILTSTSLWFMMLLTDKSTPTLAMVSDVICMACCLTFYFISRRYLAVHPNPGSADEQTPEASPHAICVHKGNELWWNLVATAMLTAYAVLASMPVLVKHMGTWDAWAIWNYRARFLSSETWRRAFDTTINSSHLDYPLAHPLSVARLWLYDSVTFGVNDTAPKFIAIHWLVVVLVMLWAVTRQMRGALVAAMTAVLFVCLSLPAENTSHQYADLPLAAMMLMTLSCVAMAVDSKRTGWWFLAGLGLAGAMWTKNEGVAFSASCFGVLVVHGLLGGRSASWRWLGALILGCLPAGLSLLCFKMTFTFSNDLVHTGQFSNMLTQALDPARHWAVLKQLASELGAWHIGPVLLLPVVWLMIPARRSRSGVLLLCCLAGHVCILYGAYLITPHDLLWHVKSSATRLACQLWPSLVLLAALWRVVPQQREVPQKNDSLPAGE